MPDQVLHASRMGDELQRDSDFTGHIETGFQLAAFQGPLCGEPVEGVAYFVEDIRVDAEGLEKEISKFLSLDAVKMVTYGDLE